MAIVPELDDPNQASQEDTSDLAAQAQSNIPTSAPSPGGVAVNNAPAPTAQQSSGTFKDFSKFRDANKTKLAALGDVATGQAKKNIGDAESAFRGAGSKYQDQINQNAKNFDTSTYKNLNLDSDINAQGLKTDLEQAGTKVDAGAYQGQLAGAKEFADLNTAVTKSGQLGSRAGTAAVLADYGKNPGNYSSTAANQDALLLQSQQGYREAAAKLAAETQGVANKTLAEEQTKIGDKSKAVNDQNTAYKSQALAALGSLRGNIDKDLESRGAAANDQRLATANATTAAARDKVLAGATQAIKDALSTPEPARDTTEHSTWLARKREAERLSKLDPMQLVKQYDKEGVLGTSIGQYNANTRAGKITADNIYRDDKKRQSQVGALEQLLAMDQNYKGGKAYNTAVLDPMSSDALSPLDQLVNQIKAGISGGINSKRALDPQLPPPGNPGALQLPLPILNPDGSTPDIPYQPTGVPTGPVKPITPGTLALPLPITPTEPVPQPARSSIPARGGSSARRQVLK